MIAILIAAACALQVNPVDDFFPLAEGTRWTYEDVKSREVWVQEAGAPIDVSGQLATPISARVDGVRGETTYYRTNGDTVFIVAYDSKRTKADPKPAPKALTAPIPTFRLATKPLKWTVTQTIPFEGGDADLVQNSEATSRGKRKVLDKMVDVIEVNVEASVGPAVHFKRTELYARGLGLIEKADDVVVNGMRSRRVTRLTKFEPPKQGND